VSPGELSAGSSSPSDLQVRSPVWRFVGDMNPEALFQKQYETTDSPGHDKVGVWQSHHKRNELSLTAATTGKRAHRGSSDGDVRRSLQNGFHFGKKSASASVLPPLEDQAALIDIYFERINVLVPLIEEGSFRESIAAGSTPIILIQAVCLVAAKDYRAKGHLRLYDERELLSVVDFCHALAAALDEAFQSRIEKNKLTLIRALALSSQHVEGPDGAEESSMQIMQAVHHAQTLGLHLDSARAEMQDESLGNLFWSLWSLDRLNACINGRPIIMSNIDIGLKIRESRLHNSEAFRVWLRIADIIDKVVEFYRPSSDDFLTGWENDFPGFEDIIRDCEALQLSPDILRKSPHTLQHLQNTNSIAESLELFYHAIAITSSRSRSFKHAPKSTPSTVRQTLSTISIIAIIQEKNGRNLLPLPVVPYSLSLALSVAYKHIRQTGLVTSRIQAMARLKQCCRLLDALADTWWSADAMAKLGRRALNEANKPPVNPKSKRERAQCIGRPRQSSHEVGSRETSVSQPEAVENLQTSTVIERNQNDRIPQNLVSEHGNMITGPQPGGNSGSNGDVDMTGVFAPGFNNPMAFDTSFDGIDQLLGDYLDLNLPTNFGDPLFVDDFYL
jgi:hypothetical protein